MKHSRIARVSLGAALALGLAACSSRAARVEPIYISPLEYRGLSCDDLSDEWLRVAEREERLAIRIDEMDPLAIGAGTLDPNEEDEIDTLEHELARLRGILEALEVVIQEDGCAPPWRSGSGDDL